LKVQSIIFPTIRERKQVILYITYHLYRPNHLPCSPCSTSPS
jgi:hypothetical protein